ncbi:hypothetical protein [Moorena sp. SIO2C4]|uniref:hypothetical protein n=1 Tax=Moorena sp. SIO2C4 TaxID=2607824 RepID=UPI00257C0A87|nr:hypothetical protein [Moorena sp. SIO2C4]
MLDRTQWQDKNLFMVGVIIGKRALPISWHCLDAIASGGNHGSRSWGRSPRPRCLPKTALHRFLNKRGASNCDEQKAILRPVLKLLKDYELVILGDIRCVLHFEETSKLRTENFTASS